MPSKPLLIIPGLLIHAVGSPAVSRHLVFSSPNYLGRVSVCLCSSNIGGKVLLAEGTVVLSVWQARAILCCCTTGDQWTGVWWAFPPELSGLSGTLGKAFLTEESRQAHLGGCYNADSWTLL